MALPARRPLGKDMPAYVAVGEPSAARASDAQVKEPSGSLTLRDALALALVGNPELAASSWEVRAAEARALQASLLPNPEVEAEVEEIAGKGERSGLGSAEVALVLSQLVELGGKRAKRVRVAVHEGALAGWDYEARRLAALTGTAKAFLEVLAAQERVALSEELGKLAEQGWRTVLENVKAGKASEVAGRKARVELVASQIELAQARRELAAGRRRLAAMWGGRSATFTQVEGRLDAVQPVPPVEQLAGLLSQHPDLARWGAELRLREAKLALERSRRVPDVTLSGGVQYFNETDEGALVVGFGLPLPLFDRNQGGIREAEVEVAKAREQRRAAETRLHADLGEAYEQLASACEQAMALKNDVVPAAQATYDAVQEGYRRGKFGYLDVLDAQRTLFEARQQHIEALGSYHQALARVEGLIGQSLTPAIEQAK